MSIFGKGGRGDLVGTGDEVNHFAMLAEVRAYWEGLRPSGALPERDAINPRGIAGALENSFLLERVAPGVARFRIAGMQLHDLMGMDVRGMPLSSLIEPAGRMRLAEALEGVFAGPGSLEIWLEGERGIGRPALEGRMLVLPLTSAQGEVGLAIGCLAMHGALGRAPRRFAIAGVMSQRIEAQGYARRAEPAVAKGFADAELPFTPRPPRGMAQLRLVHSRD